jgi:diguanylate cyclase (GGDEF)-like protein
LSSRLGDDLVAIHSSLAVEEVAKTALEVCVRAAGAAAGATYLAGAGSTRLQLSAAQGFSRPPDRDDLVGTSEAILEDGRPPELVVLLPMRGGQGLEGVLALHFREPGDIDRLELASALARQSAIALERGHRYRERRRATLTDELTGLPNEHYTERLLERELNRGMRPAYLMMALDHFKEINDGHGHGFGDQVLVDTAELLKRTIPPGAVIAHHGGAAFGVDLPEAGPEQAMAVGEALRAAVADHRFAEGLRLTLSVGVAGVEEVGRPSDLIAAADRALHAAKITGRNLVRQAPAGEPAR